MIGTIRRLSSATSFPKGSLWKIVAEPTSIDSAALRHPALQAGEETAMRFCQPLRNWAVSAAGDIRRNAPFDVQATTKAILSKSSSGRWLLLVKVQ